MRTVSAPVGLQDHYENLYVVLAGSKTFMLKPPTSVHQMHLQRYAVWQEEMREDNLSFTARPRPQAGRVTWCPIDLQRQDKLLRSPTPVRDDKATGAAGQVAGVCEHGDASPWPRFWHEPKPVTVTVNQGDMLYLPAMWYHYVTQDEGDADAVIAVNYWFDMIFGKQYAYFGLLQDLSERAGLIRESAAQG
jgi:peptidyl-lysine (3S)-dioxygenase / protease